MLFFEKKAGFSTLCFNVKNLKLFIKINRSDILLKTKTMKQIKAFSSQTFVKFSAYCLKHSVYIQKLKIVLSTYNSIRIKWRSPFLIVCKRILSIYRYQPTNFFIHIKTYKQKIYKKYKYLIFEEKTILCHGIYISLSLVIRFFTV